MAEFGAHFSTPSHGDERQSAPSIFDVLAQESLISQLRPAVSHLFRIFAESNPVRYGWLHRFSDEVYTVLHLILEQHYLRKTSASFSENFYGLKRVLCNNDSSLSSNGSKLPLYYRNLSLFCIVVIPYIKKKLDAWFEGKRNEMDDGLHGDQSFNSRLFRAFVASYPFIHMVYQGTVFVSHLLYAVNLSRRHTPLLRLAGVILEYASEDDLADQSKMTSFNWQDRSIRRLIWTAIGRFLGIVAMALSTGLSVGVFFLQFLEWWYASDHQAKIITALPIPPPPAKSFTNGLLPAMNSICPICQKIRRNDTALSITGFVFCYACIHGYVKTHGRCPMTHYPVKLDHLVRLFEAES